MMVKSALNIKVEKVTEKDFDDIYPLIIELSDRTKREDWVQLFKRQWENSENYFGYKLVHNNELIGYMGLVFSVREINGREEKFANRTSTVIRKDYRGKGLSKLLIGQLDELKGYTITTFSGNAATINVLKKNHHIDLETNVRFVFPVPTPAFFKPGVKVILKKQDIGKHLDQKDLKIYDDHVNFKCKFALLVTKNDYCFIIFNKTTKRFSPMARILYVSNMALFLKYVHLINWKICTKYFLFFSFIHERFLDGKSIRHSYKYKLPQPRVFKSESLDRKQVDSIYSELVILNI